MYLGLGELCWHNFVPKLLCWHNLSIIGEILDHVIKHMALEKLQAYSYSLPSAEMSDSQASTSAHLVLAVLPTPLVMTLVS